MILITEGRLHDTINTCTHMIPLRYGLISMSTRMAV